MEIAKAKVANALTSAASDHVIAVAADVYDENKEKYQSTLNQEFDVRLGNIESGTSGGGGELTENSVDTQHIKNGAVTEDKLSDEVKNKLNQTGGGGTSFSGSAEDVTYEGSLEASNVQEAIDKLNEKKVDREDNAPKLTAGFANNLVGRGEATEETIDFRPSGGDTSIEDGTARIERLKGNTVAWNQLGSAVSDKSVSGVTLTVKNDSFTLTGSATADGGFYNIGTTSIRVNLPDGHKGLFLLKLLSGTYTGNPLFSYGAVSLKEGEPVVRTDSTNYRYLLIRFSAGDVFDNATFSFILHDLTQMFGAGNEPITVEEFNACKPIGIDEHAYNWGELISTNVDEVKSVGFNAWDEEWEKGAIIDGKDDATPTHFRSKNYIQVLPNTDYFFKNTGTLFLSWYDEEYNYIPLGNTLAVSNGVKKSPENARYLRFYAYQQPTYNNDICIHLVHTGYRNGEYEPYEEFRRSLPITKIKDSEGNHLFPNGLLSTGNVHDEITAKKAVKRVGRMFFDGSEAWSLQSINSNNIANFSYVDTSLTNNLQAICDKFIQQTSLIANTTSEGFLIANRTLYIRIRSSMASTAEQFKSFLRTNPITLNVKLAEPIEVDLPEPLNMDYEVSDFGTEEVISDVPTTQLKADIIYQFNAVDRIRDNSRHTAEAEKLLNAKADKTTVEEIQKTIPVVVNNLTDGGADKALSAEMGKELVNMINGSRMRCLLVTNCKVTYAADPNISIGDTLTEESLVKKNFVSTYIVPTNGAVGVWAVCRATNELYDYVIVDDNDVVIAIGDKERLTNTRTYIDLSSLPTASKIFLLQGYRVDFATYVYYDYDKSDYTIYEGELLEAVVDVESEAVYNEELQMDTICKNVSSDSNIINMNLTAKVPANSVGVWLKAPRVSASDADVVSSIKVTLYNDTTPVSINGTSMLNHPLYNNEWVYVKIPVVASNVPVAYVNKVELIFTMTSGVSIPISVGTSVKINDFHRPVMLINFDNVWKSSEDCGIYDYLIENKIPFTITGGIQRDNLPITPDTYKKLEAAYNRGLLDVGLYGMEDGTNKPVTRNVSYDILLSNINYWIEQKNIKGYECRTFGSSNNITTHRMSEMLMRCRFDAIRYGNPSGILSISSINRKAYYLGGIGTYLLNSDYVHASIYINTGSVGGLFAHGVSESPSAEDQPSMYDLYSKVKKDIDIANAERLKGGLWIMTVKDFGMFKERENEYA